MTSHPEINSGSAHSYTLPTDSLEADGTFTWNSTTLILVTIQAGGKDGLGYTYSHRVTAPLARDLLEKAVLGADPFDIPAIFSKLRYFQRNYGRDGIAATALSAIDIALWDLKAKLLQVPLAKLLGQMRESAPVYGSGGFTSYSDEQLRNQLEGWIQEGIPRVKIKIGNNAPHELARVKISRQAIGGQAELFIDANGAFAQRQALDFARAAADQSNVTWFEEPVSSDDLAGLRFLREHAPAAVDIAAGEYGWTAMGLGRMLEAQSVDVLQADATRCGGVTGFMDVAALADAHPIPLSAHCAPAVHLHLACAARSLRHVEYFHDHARIEHLLFDGFAAPRSGALYPDGDRPGLGLTFKAPDAEPYKDNV